MIIDFDLHENNSGILVAIEGNHNIPFEIKRVFYIYSLDQKARRAGHALRNTEEIIICLKGKCTCFLDDGLTKEEIVLDNPCKGLYVKKATWLDLTNFSEDCILLILTDKYYDNTDSIHNYNEFLKLKEGSIESSGK